MPAQWQENPSGSTERGAVSVEDECFQLLEYCIHVIIPVKYLFFRIPYVVLCGVTSVVA